MLAWSAMETEPHMYIWPWDKVTSGAERWLSVACEIREGCMVYLKQKHPEMVEETLERVFAGGACTMEKPGRRQSRRLKSGLRIARLQPLCEPGLWLREKRPECRPEKP
jgi:hypothetical protein